MSHSEQNNHGDRGQRLDSWKQIAAHLGREVRTVQRWEKTEGLPVYRHQHDKRGTVHAYSADLDAWRSERLAQLEALPQNGDRPWWAGKTWIVLVLLPLVALGGFLAWSQLRQPSRTAASSLAAGCDVPAGLISHWPADNTTRDSLGQNDGKVEGGVIYSPGRSGMAFRLDGEAGHIRVRKPKRPTGSEPFTVAAWVRFEALTHPPGANTATAPQEDMSIVDAMSDEFINRDGWRLLKQRRHQFMFCVGGATVNGCSGYGTSVSSKTVVTAGTWYHVAAARGEDQIALYVNGQLEGTADISAHKDTGSTDLRIGSYILQGAYLNGLIDEVMLFDRALSGAEVQALHADVRESRCAPNVITSAN